jgi:hypothetical protein
MDLRPRVQIAQLRSHLPIVRPRRAKPKASTTALSVVTSKHRRGVLAGTVASGQFAPDTLFPFLGRAVVQSQRPALMWFYKDDEDVVSSGTIGINQRGQRRLGITSSKDISLDLPNRFPLRARTPPAQDLPPGASIHVSPKLFKSFRTKALSHTYALLTTDQGVAAPVRLAMRPIGDEYILAPMSVRTLCGITEGSQIQLSTFPKFAPLRSGAWLAGRIFRRSPNEEWKRHLGIAFGLILVGIRFIDLAIELVLRVTLRSQPLAFRVIQANPGDDDLWDTIRIHPAAFAALATNPGGQVLLNWAGQRMAARVLADPNPVDTPASPVVLNSVGLRLDTGLLPDGFPAHLVVRIPAPLRTSLNIPPATIIEIRRRLRPAVISQLNTLTIPVAGLIVTAAALPEVRGWPLIIGAIAALILGLAPLRMPRPPRGRWP